jgi:hypothetical protein
MEPRAYRWSGFAIEKGVLYGTAGVTPEGKQKWEVLPWDAPIAVQALWGLVEQLVETGEPKRFDNMPSDDESA